MVVNLGGEINFAMQMAQPLGAVELKDIGTPGHLHPLLIWHVMANHGSGIPLRQPMFQDVLEVNAQFLGWQKLHVARKPHEKDARDPGKGRL